MWPRLWTATSDVCPSQASHFALALDRGHKIPIPIPITKRRGEASKQEPLQVICPHEINQNSSIAVALVETLVGCTTEHSKHYLLIYIVVLRTIRITELRETESYQHRFSCVRGPFHWSRIANLRKENLFDPHLSWSKCQAPPRELPLPYPIPSHTIWCLQLS